MTSNDIDTEARKTALKKIAARDAKSAAAQAKFDKLPVAVQMLSGIGTLLLVALIGFACLYAIDILFLDFDPLGRLLGIFSPN